MKPIMDHAKTDDLFSFTFLCSDSCFARVLALYWHYTGVQKRSGINSASWISVRRMVLSLSLFLCFHIIPCVLQAFLRRLISIWNGAVYPYLYRRGSKKPQNISNEEHIFTYDVAVPSLFSDMTRFLEQVLSNDTYSLRTTVSM